MPTPSANSEAVTTVDRKPHLSAKETGARCHAPCPGSEFSTRTFIPTARRDALVITSTRFQKIARPFRAIRITSRLQ